MWWYPDYEQEEKDIDKLSSELASSFEEMINTEPIYEKAIKIVLDAVGKNLNEEQTRGIKTMCKWKTNNIVYNYCGSIAAFIIHELRRQKFEQTRKPAYEALKVGDRVRINEDALFSGEVETGTIMEIGGIIPQYCSEDAKDKEIYKDIYSLKMYGFPHCIIKGDDGEEHDCAMECFEVIKEEN